MREPAKKGHLRYYLVKDVRVGQRVAKLKKYLGSKASTPREVSAYEKKFALGLELKAAATAGRLGALAYQAKYLTPGQVSALEEIRYLAKLAGDSLTKSELAAYERQFEVGYVQGTTAIEGNTLTLRETADLLLYGIVPGGRSLREINEVQNFKSVKAYRDKYKGRVNPAFIKKIHAMIMHNIDEESAGSFRRADDIGILGADFRPCPSIMIESELRRISEEYYQRLKMGSHPFEEAVMFHYAFETIHPFTDGNGRVGREILNFMLARKGYPRLLLTRNERARYLEALRLGNGDKCCEMVPTFAFFIIDQKADVLRQNIRNILG